MSGPSKIRAAAVQFAAGPDVAKNLDTSRRMIDEAAAHRPDLIVLPEFSNHCSWYRDAAHCFEVAVSIDGDFMAGIADKARQHGCYVMVNATLRRGEPCVTGTNVLFGPDGQRIAVSDKQVLMGNENNFLTRAKELGPIVDLPFGRLGMYSCMDGVIFETARCLALRGPQILCNSLNSFALDEASLHVPVRAAENRVFVVAANKVGPLVPEDLLEAVAAKLKIAPRFLHGAGEAQIVSPRGEVLAIAPRSGEAVAVAEIDVREAEVKVRSTGTHIFSSRRPDLYRPIALEPEPRAYHAGPSSVLAATVTTASSDQDELVRLLREAIHLGAALIVLPELAFAENGVVADLREGVESGAALVSALRLELTNTTAIAAASIVERSPEGFAHTAVALSAAGEVLRQRALHQSARHPWATLLASELSHADTAVGRLALLPGEDTLYPEAFRLAALADVEIVACPMHVVEQWETRTGLPERAAENRFSVVAASRRTPAGASIIATVGEDFTLWTVWKNRPFDGNINYPILTKAVADGVTTATIYPANAGNRTVTQKTDVVDSRPFRLLGPMVG